MSHTTASGIPEVARVDVVCRTVMHMTTDVAGRGGDGGVIPMTQPSVAKIVVAPIDHYAGARHTRRTWFAALASEDGSELVRCAHDREGHRTVAAAITCGRALDRKWTGR